MMKPRFLPYGAVKIEKWSKVLRTICFAQLRAEIMENHAQEAWKSSEIMKDLIFRIPKISTFQDLSNTFTYGLQD